VRSTVDCADSGRGLGAEPRGRAADRHERRARADRAPGGAAASGHPWLCTQQHTNDRHALHNPCARPHGAAATLADHQGDKRCKCPPQYVGCYGTHIHHVTDIAGRVTVGLPAIKWRAAWLTTVAGAGAERDAVGGAGGAATGLAGPDAAAGSRQGAALVRFDFQEAVLSRMCMSSASESAAHPEVSALGGSGAGDRRRRLAAAAGEGLFCTASCCTTAPLSASDATQA
jgi:hypothetical protein